MTVTDIDLKQVESLPVWSHWIHLMFYGKPPEDLECEVGKWSVRFSYRRTRDIRIDEWSTRKEHGLQTVTFRVHHEMIKHVPEWAGQPPLKKVAAALLALVTPGYPGAHYNFQPQG